MAFTFNLHSICLSFESLRGCLIINHFARFTVLFYTSMVVPRLLLVLNALSLLTLTHAWTFVWRDASNTAFVEHSNTAMACTQIHHAQGRLFNWDSEGQSFAISLYLNTDCSGPPEGYATHYFNKNASKPINSFKVDSTASTTSIPPTTTTSTSPNTSQTTMTTSQTQTQSSQPTATASSSSSHGSGLSRGPIAGIVVGVVAGVSLVGIIFYFLGRRSQRKAPGSGDTPNIEYGAPSAQSPTVLASPSSWEPGLAYDERKKQELSSDSGVAHRPGRVIELQGNSPAHELDGQIGS